MNAIIGSVVVSLLRKASNSTASPPNSLTGTSKKQSWLPARKPGGLETSSRARHAGPAGGNDHCCHHPRDPLAAAFSPRLVFRTLDGYVNVAPTPVMWKRFCKAIATSG